MPRNVPIVRRFVHWYCPNCQLEDVTHEQRPHSRFHTCPKLGLVAPMLPAGTKAKVFSVEREDYLGTEIVRRDANGRPKMSVVTVRDDGQDCIAFAPLAVATGKGL